MIKKIVYLLLSLSILLNIFMFINLFYNINNNMNDTIQETSRKNETIEEMFSIENISREEKVKVAEDLCKNLINSQAIKFNYFGNVTDEFSNRQAILTFKNYRITNVEILEEKGNKFIANISYDIQCTDEYQGWISGSGDIENDNWIKNKVYTLDIEKYKNKYLITNISY